MTQIGVEAWIGDFNTVKEALVGALHFKAYREVVEMTHIIFYHRFASKYI